MQRSNGEVSHCLFDIGPPVKSHANEPSILACCATHRRMRIGQQGLNGSSFSGSAPTSVVFPSLTQATSGDITAPATAHTTTRLDAFEKDQLLSTLKCRLTFLSMRIRSLSANFLPSDKKTCRCR